MRNVSVNRIRVVSGSLLMVAVAMSFFTTAGSQPLTRASDSTGPVVSFQELLARPVSLKPELKGQHPRIFFTAKSLEELRHRAASGDREMWQAELRNVRSLTDEPPPPGSPMLNRSGVEQEDGDLSQYSIAYILAQNTFAYAIEHDRRSLDQAKKWLFTIVKYDPWGYSFRSPNVDLPPAHFLYAVAFAYDTLYNELSSDERTMVRTKLANQSRLLYEFFKYKPRKKYSFSQNHTFIPMTGLAIAAFALLDEEPEAVAWAQLARAVYERVLQTFGVDGYYYEGFHYCVFSLHWIVRYMDALEHATGEDLYPAMRERFLPMKYYFAHEVLPNGRDIFDFGDAGTGATDRNSSKSRGLNTGWEVLYRFAAKYKDRETEAIADWLGKDLKTSTWEAGWALWAHDQNVKAASMGEIPKSYFFKDSGVAYWRSDWTSAAKAIAFRCGPPEGHHVTELLPRVPEWRLNTGHAHPDANSFIVFAHGHYLTGDTGYTGVKMTRDHNTVLVDDRGQEKDGRHEMFTSVPYERLDKIRLTEVWSAPDAFYAKGEAAAAYYSDLGVQKFERNFLFVAPDHLVVWDQLSSDQPRTFSWLLNSDAAIEKAGANVMTSRIGGTSLSVEALFPSAITVEVRPLVVTSQGRPGEVENGQQVQRGFQLVEKITEPTKDGEFLNLISIGRATAVDNQVTRPLGGQARGVQMNWSDGDEERIVLSGAINEISTDGLPAVAKWKKSGEWQRMAFRNGRRMAVRGSEVVSASGLVSVSLEKAETGAVRGSIESSKSVGIRLAIGSRPKSVLVNGNSVPFRYSVANCVVSFVVNVNENRIEIR